MGNVWIFHAKAQRREGKNLIENDFANKKQLLTYFRPADKRLGLLINFGEELIKTGITRVVNGLMDGGSSPSSRLCAFA